MLIDGMSVREEPVAYAFHYALGKIPLFGGSAGAGLRFSQTFVFSQGKFHPDSTVLILVHTTFNCRTFMTQHFTATDERMVVTEADPPRRLVKEINGLPAAAEYARLVGMRVADLNPNQLAISPVVVKLGGTDHVRAIQKANDDGSLTFFCAIDEGLVLRLGQAGDLVGNLGQAHEKVRAEIGPPQLVICCDCVLRNLEIFGKHLQTGVEDLFQRNNAIGFSSYGEQFQGVHVNQTFTAVAIGGTPETCPETQRGAEGAPAHQPSRGTS
jgi:hypothetical protein